MRDVSIRANYDKVSSVSLLERIDVTISDISIGLNTKQLVPAYNALELLTGQKPIFLKSRRVIQQFNLRKGILIGAKVTLKGDLIYQFLETLSCLVLPKLEEPISKKSIDKNGNISITLRDPFSFFELDQEFEKFKKLPNISINISTRARTKKDSLAILSYINIPFR